MARMACLDPLFYKTLVIIYLLYVVDHAVVSVLTPQWRLL